MKLNTVRKELFEESLSRGLVGESLIAEFFKRQGCFILPIYKTSDDPFKGPRLVSAAQELVAPDMLVFANGKSFWLEAKKQVSLQLVQKWRHLGNWHRPKAL